MSRTIARECAFKLIFEYIFTKEIDEELLSDYTNEEEVKDEGEFVKKLYFGVREKFDYLYDKINRLSIGFVAHRIYKVDLAILLLATYEIEFMPDVPVKVSINEACNLAKTYSTEKSVKFVNGILAKVKEECKA